MQRCLKILCEFKLVERKWEKQQTFYKNERHVLLQSKKKKHKFIL